MRSLALGLLTLASLATAAPTCIKSPYEWWTEDVQAGHRGFIVNAWQGGASFTCAAKGSSAIDEVLDPVVQNHVNIGVFAQNSKMPCQLFREWFSKPGVQPGCPLCSGGDGENESAEGTDSRRLNSSCSALGGPGTCTYPKQEELGQHHWGGVSFKISRVNGKHTTEGTTRGVAYEPPFNAIDSAVSHGHVYSGTEVACELPDSDTHLYTSGVVLSGSPLPGDMRYRVYSFASEMERQAALDNTRNEGLQYARAMKGENGCDVEIVYEFFPKTGGGLQVEITQTMQATTRHGSAEFEDMTHRITDSTNAYLVPEESVAIVRVSSASLRESQYLPPREGCDEGMSTTIKFSTQFICKATGQRVNITSITLKRVDGHEHPISTDPNNPTFFQLDPNNPSDCYYKMDCLGFQHGPDFLLTMDATSAPESCGSFYWDPLLHAVSGDGQSASAARGIASRAAPGNVPLAGKNAVFMATLLWLLLP